MSAQAFRQLLPPRSMDRRPRYMGTGDLSYHVRCLMAHGKLWRKGSSSSPYTEDFVGAFAQTFSEFDEKPMILITRASSSHTSGTHPLKWLRFNVEKEVLNGLNLPHPDELKDSYFSIALLTSLSLFSLGIRFSVLFLFLVRSLRRNDEDL